ncbi:HalOD1 output domain-containing protein [Natronomonas sp.]|uniref:HalOD1 output domain-containing protein n=1 Tax=Natronomonas sp. TaxID=2184060 RepID=UPI0039760C81
MVPDMNVDGETTVSETLIEAVADAAHVDTTVLPPLYYYVDPDALDKLFARGRTKSPAITTEFVYAGYDVRITGGDEVTVTIEERTLPGSTAGTVGIDADIE